MKSRLSATTKKEKEPNIVLVYLYRFFNYLVVLTVIIALLTGYFFLLEPKYDKIKKEASLQLEKYKSAKMDREEYVGKLNQYQSSFKKIDQANQAKVDSMIDANIVPESIYSEISALVASKNIILNSVTIKEQPEKQSEKNPADTGLGTDVGVLDFTIVLMGLDYAGLKDLLATMEKSIHMYQVTNVSFSLADNSATLQVKKYYLQN